MNHQVFIERILENEGLTGDLEDEPAARLLKWGTGLVPGLVEKLDDAEAAGAKVNALARWLRCLGKTAGSCADLETGGLVSETVVRYRQVSGCAGLKRLWPTLGVL